MAGGGMAGLVLGFIPLGALWGPGRALTTGGSEAYPDTSASVTESTTISATVAYARRL